MRRYIIWILFFSIAILLSCEKRGWFVKCRECTPDEPEDAILYIKLNNPLTPITLKVYEGELDDSILFYTDQITWPDYTIHVPLNKKYTVTAVYYIDGIKYIAVDAATPRLKYTEDQCDDPCYYVYNNDLDLRLKYTAEGK